MCWAGQKPKTRSTRTFITYDDEGAGPQVTLGSNIGGAKTLKPEVQLDRLNWMKKVTSLNLPDDSQISVERPTLSDLGSLFRHCAKSTLLIVSCRAIS